MKYKVMTRGAVRCAAGGLMDFFENPGFVISASDMPWTIDNFSNLREFFRKTDSAGNVVDMGKPTGYAVRYCSNNDLRIILQTARSPSRNIYSLDDGEIMSIGVSVISPSQGVVSGDEFYSPGIILADGDYSYELDDHGYGAFNCGHGETKLLAKFLEPTEVKPIRNLCRELDVLRQTLGRD